MEVTYNWLVVDTNFNQLPLEGKYIEQLQLKDKILIPQAESYQVYEIIDRVLILKELNRYSWNWVAKFLGSDIAILKQSY